MDVSVKPMMMMMQCNEGMSGKPLYNIVKRSNVNS